MANFDLFYPTLLKFEGGYVNNPNDKGGRTKYGVTEAVWKQNGGKKDIKDITTEDAKPIAKKLYWDKMFGDQVVSQSVAEFIVDWAFMSGVVGTVKKIQEVLGIPQDGVFGKNTLFAINSANPKNLFDHLKMRRQKFFDSIVANNPSQKVFLKGWTNRNNMFVWKG